MPAALAIPRFALNHMVAPQRDLAGFFALARAVGLDAVEIRNDIAGQAILDGTPPARVKALAEEAGVRILTINALQRFNQWDAERKEEAGELARYARECGAAGLILVPANDGTGREPEERRARLEEALAGLAPILEAEGIVGLVEPLGFESCSLRLKSEAAAAIEARGGGRFRLTHDTFHHNLAGEAAIFPRLTGLVHISGVEAPELATADMRDAHRVLVGPADRLDNIGQLAQLLASGYPGPVSFEPFAAEIARLADPAGAIRRSMTFISEGLAAGGGARGAA